ncbi:hypothetical protein [Variovorax paradoxus]|uniref:hypothetical protein n=1 Tax=Variovorax paradoxus TaxID=34073 RepID=UPI0019323605|nr:hypothetical protein INQ48_13815 [Variovorax paradoxus]
MFDLINQLPVGVQALFFVGGLVIAACIGGLYLDDVARRRRARDAALLGVKALEQCKR